jgi:hypothetical protein
MKRFLNKAREVSIVLFDTGYVKKFKLGVGVSAIENEILTGIHSGTRYFFIHKGGALYSLTHDDLTYDFVRLEKEQLESSLSSLATSINNLTIQNLVEEDEGV